MLLKRIIVSNCVDPMVVERFVEPLLGSYLFQKHTCMILQSVFAFDVLANSFASQQ